MVYELKPPVDGSPGVLIFTHKERAFFFDPPIALETRLHQLCERYVVGMQWGRYHEDVGETPFVDFHMACPGTVEFRSSADIRHIPLCSRNFTPSYFRPMDVPIEWDLLSVGHPISDKRYSELLDVLRMVFDAGVDLRVLLFCAVPDDPESLGRKWDREFFEKYESLFSEAERNRIDLAVPGEVEFGRRPIHPLPNKVFPYLYNASKSFTLFSQEEGQSKVIHEALLCGTPVVVRGDLRGGGRDYLDERNSVQFSTPIEARDAFIDIAKRPDAYSFDPSYLRPELAEEETAPDLEQQIADIFASLGHDFEGAIERTDLAFKLGGHTITLSADLRRRNTNDLRSRDAMVRYLDDLLGQSTGVGARFNAMRADAHQRAATLRTRGVTGAAGTILSSVDQHTSLPVFSVAKRLHDRFGRL